VLFFDTFRIGALRLRQSLLQLLDTLTRCHQPATAGGYNDGCVR
jgi:hypothetical protein